MHEVTTGTAAGTTTGSATAPAPRRRRRHLPALTLPLSPAVTGKVTATRAWSHRPKAQPAPAAFPQVRGRLRVCPRGDFNHPPRAADLQLRHCPTAAAAGVCSGLPSRTTDNDQRDPGGIPRMVTHSALPPSRSRRRIVAAARLSGWSGRSFPDNTAGFRTERRGPACWGNGRRRGSARPGLA